MTMLWRREVVLSCELADLAVLEASRRATVEGLSVAIAVCDAGGTLKAFRRMDDACLASVDLATAKAYCAVAYGRSTATWCDAGDSPAAVRLGLSTVSGFAPVGGGVPVVAPDGTLVGGIGVSGASEQEDALIAEAAAHAISASEGCA